MIHHTFLCSLFVRDDELKHAWKLFDPLLEAIDNKSIPVHIYPRGSRGPPQGDHMVTSFISFWSIGLNFMFNRLQPAAIRGTKSTPGSDNLNNNTCVFIFWVQPLHEHSSNKRLCTELHAIYAMIYVTDISKRQSGKSTCTWRRLMSMACMQRDSNTNLFLTDLAVYSDSTHAVKSSSLRLEFVMDSHSMRTCWSEWEHA